MSRKLKKNVINYFYSRLFQRNIIFNKVDKKTNTLNLVIRQIDEDGRNRDTILSETQHKRLLQLNEIRANKIEPILACCRKIVGAFKHCEALQRLLYDKQKQLNQKIKVY